MVPNEQSIIMKLDDNDSMSEQAKRIIEHIGKHTDPENVICMMGIIVQKPPAGSEKNVTINAFVLGSDEDIARMLSTLVTVTRNGIVQANTPQNHNDEVKH